MEADDVSAYDVAAANVRLAVDFASVFAQRGEKVAILLPDEAERDIACEKLGSDSPFPNVKVRALRESDEEDTR